MENLFPERPISRIISVFRGVPVVIDTIDDSRFCIWVVGYTVFLSQRLNRLSSLGYISSAMHYDFEDSRRRRNNNKRKQLIDRCRQLHRNHGCVAPEKAETIEDGSINLRREQFPFVRYQTASRSINLTRMTKISYRNDDGYRSLLKNAYRFELWMISEQSRESFTSGLLSTSNDSRVPACPSM